MATMTYKQQLLSPNWQRRRLQMLEAAGWACTRCSATEKTLHVHHRQYVKGRMAWEYGDDELAVLCDDCHASEHERKDFLQRLMIEAEGSGIPADMLAIGLVAGYRYAMGELQEATAAEAYAFAGPFFEEGMLASSASIARGPDIARLVRDASSRWGHPIQPLQEEVLQRLERAEPGDL